MINCKISLSRNNKCTKISHIKNSHYNNLENNRRFLQLNSLFQLNVLKVFGLLITLSLTSICIYQIADRFKFYYSFPKAVNIDFEELNKIEQFEVKICSPLNEYIKKKSKFLNQASLAHDLLYPHERLIALNNTNHKELWKFNETFKIMSKIIFYEKQKKLSIVSNITPSVENTVLGKCDVVEFGGFLTYKPAIILIGEVFVLVINEQSSFRQGYVILKHSSQQWFPRFTKYTHMRTSNDQCVSNEEFNKCYNDCVTRLILKNINCSLPFHSKEIKLPACDRESAILSFKKTTAIVIGLDIFGECKCTKMCKQIGYLLTYDDNEKTLFDGYMIINADNFVYSVTEISAYGAVNLLTDIAGNLALYLGFTFLQMLDFFYKIVKKIFTLKITANKSRSILEEDKPLLTKISIFKKPLLSTKVIKLLWWTTCMCVTFTIVENHVKYFFTYPTRTILLLEAQPKIQLPSVIICGPSNKLIFQKRKFAQLNNSTNGCDYDILDIIDVLKKNRTEKLWDLSLPTRLPALEISIQDRVPVKFLQPNETTERSFIGDCWKTNFNFEVYRGVETMHISLFYYKNKICNKDVFQIFTQDTESTFFNILSGIRIPTGMKLHVDFRYNKLTRIYQKVRPCSKIKDFNTCKQNCFLKKIQESNLCRLPFFPLIIKSEPCKTLKSAKYSQKKYIENMINMELTHCECILPCKENILLKSISLTITKQDVVEFYQTMFSNIIDHRKEIELFTLISLFCDIGNIIGITLGISILNLTNFIIAIFSFTRKFFLHVKHL